MLKRKRDPVFASSEKMALIELVQKHFDILECKKTDATTMSAKNNKWRELADEFNTLSSLYPREWSVLKNCWENLKKRAKQQQTLRNQHFLATGGGPSKHFLEEPAIQKVLELIQTRVSGFINIYDSDSTHVIAGGGSGNGDVRVAPSSVEHLTLCDQNHAQNPDSSEPMVLEITSTQTLTTVTGPNWSQYSPSMLRDFRNPVLEPSPPPPDVQVIDQQTNLSPNPQNFIHSPRFHTRVPTTSPAATSRRRPTLRHTDVNAQRVEILAQSSEYAQEEHTIKKQLLEQEVLKLKLANEHALEEHDIRMQILRHQEQQEQLKLKQEALKVELLELQIKKLKD